ncbi:MAG: 3-hydroxybenzoate 6-monooxygenase, partial [Sphingomonadaceae bacterium]
MVAQSLIIAGAGIGGLAAALGLSREGFNVIVLERAPVLGEIGAGIQLGPNAFHAFDHLGIGEQTRKMAVHIDKLRLMDALSADEIANIPLGEAFRKRFGAPYAVIHRGDLHGVFLRACLADPMISVRVNSEVEEYSRYSDGVSVRLVTGDVVEGVALIGADGIASAVRRQLVGDSEPRSSGHTTYRSVIPTEQMPEELRWNAATLWAGPKCHIVHYPLSGWKSFNLVVTSQNGATEAVAGVSVETDLVRAQFAHVSPRAQEIIKHGTNWKAWVLCDRDPVDNWVDGNVALLGDAAHPMLQYFAQGACMAVEDAVALAQSLALHRDDIAGGLQLYQSLRLVRTGRVQLQSREIGQHIYHPAGAHAKIRN